MSRPAIESGWNLLSVRVDGRPVIGVQPLEQCPGFSPEPDSMRGLVLRRYPLLAPYAGKRRPPGLGADIPVQLVQRKSRVPLRRCRIAISFEHIRESLGVVIHFSYPKSFRRLHRAKYRHGARRHGEG